MGIERKWRLRNLPAMLKPEIPDLEVFQAYVSCLDFDGETRVSRFTNPYTGGIKYRLTFKTNGTLSRQEFEIDIPIWLFELLC